MGYLIVEIIVLLLIAAAIGFVIGWFLRRGGAGAADVEAEYSGRLEAAEKKNEALNKELEEDQAEIERLRSQLEETRREVDEERERTGNLEGEMGTVREKEAALAAALSDVSNREKEIERLKGELDSARAGDPDSRAATLQAEVSRMRSELETARAAHKDCATDIQALNRRIAELEGDDDATPAAAPDTPEPAPTSAADLPRPTWLLDKPDGDVDDLKRIKGVGPVMENTLNELGIYHFRQVAQLDADGIEWVSANIETFPGRIVRDGWVEQARDLHKEKYGTSP